MDSCDEIRIVFLSYSQTTKTVVQLNFFIKVPVPTFVFVVWKYYFF